MRNQLDVAIDCAATSLVTVAPDEMLADQIASRLPERSRRRLKPSPSNWTRLAPQFAAAAGVALLASFLISNRPAKIVEAPAIEATAVPPPIVERAPVVTPAVVANSVVTSLPDDNTFDRDYGLLPVATIHEIAVTVIATTSPLGVPSAEIAPIVLADLPLASDSPSPR